MASTLSPYAYVAGDPLNRTHDSGGCPECVAVLGGAAIGAFLGGMGAALSDYVSGNTSNFWADTLRGAAVSGATGAAMGLCGSGCAEAAGSFVTGLIGAGGGAFASGATNAINQGFDNGWSNVDWSSVGQSTFFGGLGGGAGGYFWSDAGPAFSGLFWGEGASAIDARYNLPGEPFPFTGENAAAYTWGGATC